MTSWLGRANWLHSVGWTDWTDTAPLIAAIRKDMKRANLANAVSVRIAIGDGRGLGIAMWEGATKGRTDGDEILV